MRRQEDDLPILDLEQVKLDEKAADLVIKVSATLQVNKKMEWSLALGKYTNSIFSVSDFKAKLEEVFDMKEGFEKGYQITNRQVIIRSIHARARCVLQSLDDFSETEWDKAIKIIFDEAERWNPELDIKIEVLAESESANQKPLKRSHNIISSDSIEQPLPKS